MYSNSETEDDVTHSLRGASNEWRPIADQSDDDVVRRIQRDKIDILVDLSGHSDGHRLEVFRRKPAPVQMTWLGYVATTGLKEIDYILADSFTLPTSEESFFTEAPLRLSHTHFIFQPPETSPSIQSPPMMKHSGITFGCLNNIRKLNEDVIGVWSRILHAVPGSRMIIKYPQLSVDYIADSVKEFFYRNGFEEEQLILLGQTSHGEHLAAYNLIDIALDPFPYSGTMTTLETLWMGVPVITLDGTRWPSRVGTSILSTIGLPDMIAKTPSDYIEIAVTLARNKDELSSLRRNMRIMLKSSPLCDTNRFTRTLENLFQDAWKTWCLG